MKANFPEKLGILFQPSRYIVLYGGRGGAKSWGVARSLIIRGAQKPIRILCARETQRSIADSVHKLLSDQIFELGLQGEYVIQQNNILGKNGTEFIFAGLRQNISNLKSYESVDICWVEEAQVVSKQSWEILIPTIRKDGSQIIITMNPELDTDDTYKRFILSPPPNSTVVKINWRDNPWFPDVLKQEKDYCRITDPVAYDHIWEGMCLRSVEGAIYEKELRAAEEAGRITKVPYDASQPVQTFWDLGDRYTAIWFAQAFPFEHRLIDYMEGEALSLKQYLKEIQAKEYVYSMHFLPHDARSPQLGTGRSIEEQMRSAGFPVRIVPRLSLASGINAARTIFPQCWFDGDKCADGLQALRHYRWSPDGTLGQEKKEPLHDWASHGADAFRYFAVGVRLPKRDKPAEEVPVRQYGAWS